MKAKAKFWSLAVIATVSLFCSAFPSSAAVNMYLNIPGIKGESISANYPQQIAVSTYSEGIMNTNTAVGSGPGKASFADIAIVKNLDSASTPLYLACAQGTPFQNVVLTVTRASGGGSEMAFYTLTMNSVVVKSVQTSVSSGGSPMETLVLVCGSIQWSYTPQNPDGTLGTPIVHTWSVLTNSGN